MSDKRSTSAPDAVVGGPNALQQITEHYQRQRRALVQKVSEIEAFLGFVQQSDDLSVRIAKIEAFLGIKG